MPHEFRSNMQYACLLLAEHASLSYRAEYSRLNALADRGRTLARQEPKSKSTPANRHFVFRLYYQEPVSHHRLSSTSQSWPKSLYEPASSSATHCSADGRWSCTLHLTILRYEDSTSEYSRLTTHSDVLHPSRANVSKEDLRTKLSELYKVSKDQVSCFGFRTQYGGGKSTGFALIYESNAAMKKFEPRYRLVRVGMATKVEKASRQQREYFLGFSFVICWNIVTKYVCRQATQEQIEGGAWYGEDQGCNKEEGRQIDVRRLWLRLYRIAGEQSWLADNICDARLHISIDLYLAVGESKKSCLQALDFPTH